MPLFCVPAFRIKYVENRWLLHHFLKTPKMRVPLQLLGMSTCYFLLMALLQSYYVLAKYDPTKALKGVKVNVVKGDLFSGPRNKESYKSELHYTKVGNLEVSYEADVNHKVNFTGNFKPTLFFDAEKENRQVFNLDVCIDFFDASDRGEQKSGVMIFCYKGQLNDSQIVKENEELAPNVKRVLDDLKNKCQLSMGGLRGPRRGFRLDFNPPIYDFYSLVDMQKYTINTTDFKEDEIRVLRQNQVPKYCMRLEMGRLPPDPDEVDEQRTDLQDAVREFLFESDANNRTDNITELLHAIKGITLEVEDLQQEMVLKTVDWAAHPDAYVYGSQKNRESARLFGLLPNRTEDELPYENKTRKHFISSRLYNDIVPKVKTDKNYNKPSWIEMDNITVEYSGIHFLNFSFNGGNIFPCRSEWVELEKFQMERDFYHSEIHAYFSPIHLAYTVGLVGWKNESDRGFGPGYEKKGKFGPDDTEIQELTKVLPMTEGFLSMEERYLLKFGNVSKLPPHVWSNLEDYYVPLQLNHSQPLGEVTVKQLVFVCSDYTFNLPHVASFTEGTGL